MGDDQILHCKGKHRENSVRRGFLTRPGDNCWRIETAERASYLIDGEAYFSMVREALLKARHSVLLLGWNFSDRAQLLPGRQDPDWPDELGPFLKALIERQPSLAVNVLVWDKAPVLALGRREVPGAQTLRMNQGGVRYHLDTAHPAFAAHHQKILVIDDAIAFCGGFDFAANRWDTRAHEPGDPRRRMPNGLPYDAHHDVMLAVDGDAARALGHVARERWLLASGEALPRAPAGLDAWPGRLAPHFRTVPVAIARTAPAWGNRPVLREAEALFLDSIAAARHSIYIESQYFASARIADAIAARLAEPDGPEIVVVNPKRAPSLTEQVAMDTARTRMLCNINDADHHGRFRLFAAVNGEEEIVVHSKVMVVDDSLLRIGSANLNNRSMGVDTECDLAIEAARAPDAAAVRQRIVEFRNDLLAEHLGVSVEVLTRSIAEEGSILRAIDALNGTQARQLACFPEPQPSRLVPVGHNALMDPEKPFGSSWNVGRSGLGALGVLAALTAVVVLRAHRRREKGGTSSTKG